MIGQNLLSALFFLRKKRVNAEPDAVNSRDIRKGRGATPTPAVFGRLVP